MSGQYAGQPRVIEVMTWHPPVPGSDSHVSRIDAARAREAGPGLSWRDAGRCAEVGGDLWFPEGGGNVARAKRICLGCEVRERCLEFALANFERFGVWGAKTSPERKRILAEMEPGVPRCESGWHALTGGNLLPGGGCRACGEVRSERDRQTRQERRELAA